MLFGLITIFVVLIGITFLEEYIGKYKWLIFISIGLILILYAGLRPIGFDKDSQNYEAFFMHPDSKEAAIAVEPSFIWICKIVNFLFGDVRFVLIIFAIMGVIIKTTAIKRGTFLIFPSLVIYFGNFYFLHEMTQIRAGIATALFLLAITYQAEQMKVHSLMLIALACTFHYSSLALLPLLFINNKPLSRKLKIIFVALCPLCFVLYALNLDVLTTVPIPYISDKIDAYKMASEYGNVEKNSILNPFPIMRIAIFLFTIYYSKTIEKTIPYINIYIKIMACSLIVYFAFSSITIISTRIFELYGVVEILAYPCIIYAIRPRFLGKIFVCIIAIIETIFNAVVWNFFDFSI